LTKNDTRVEADRKLTEGCIWAYTHAHVGIMPKIYDQNRAHGSTSIPCALF